MDARPRDAKRTVEAVALGLLAAVPVLPYLLELRRGVPRFVVEGDGAGLEIATRFAFTGRTLLGPYSRFHFNHPGPAYFFFLAPIYEACGRTSTGLYVGACLLAALAAFLLVFYTRLLASRAHGLGAAFVVLAWMAAFGNVTPQPWNPLVVVLPLLSFFVLASLFAIGHASAAPPAVALAAIAAETHLSTVPAVCVTALAATIAFVLVARKRAALSRRDRIFLFVAAALAVLAVLPPLVEQLTEREGNLTKLARFFLHRPEPPKPLAEALRGWIVATGWMPERVLAQTLAHEGEPNVMRTAPLAESSNAARLAAALLVASAIAAAVVALRRRDRVSLALLAAGVVTSVSSAVAAACRDVARPWPGVAGAALVFAMATTASSLQRAWLADGNYVALDRPREELRDLHAALTARIAARHETPVIHPDAGWHIALALLNELSRDGIDARVERDERWILGAQLDPPDGAPRPLHVYSQTPAQPLPTTPCLELLAKSHDVELWVSATRVSTCPE